MAHGAGAYQALMRYVAIDTRTARTNAQYAAFARLGNYAYATEGSALGVA